MALEEQNSANTPRGAETPKPAALVITPDEQALRSQRTALVKSLSPTEGDAHALGAQNFKTDYVTTDAKRKVSGVEVAKQTAYGALSIGLFIAGFFTGGAALLLLPFTARGMYKIQSKAHEAFVNQHWGQYDQPTLKAFVSAAAQGIKLSDKIKGPDGKEIGKTVQKAMIEFYGHLSVPEMTSRLRTLSTDFAAVIPRSRLRCLGY
ncbi:MAG: hypothetical protein WCK42_02635 [Myxococcaceae bacterium]